MSAGSVVRRLAVVATGFVVAGALAGVLWEALWQPPDGVAVQGKWFFNPAGPDVAFAGTALYVVIAVPVGLALGLSSGLLKGRELVTGLAVLVASGLAGVLMYAVGHALGPDDPRALAAESEDYSTVPGALVLNPEPGHEPWASTALLALPAGAMTGLAASFLVIPGRPRVHPVTRASAEFSDGSVRSVTL